MAPVFTALFINLSIVQNSSEVRGCVVTLVEQMRNKRYRAELWFA